MMLLVMHSMWIDKITISAKQLLCLAIHLVHESLNIVGIATIWIQKGLFKLFLILIFQVQPPSEFDTKCHGAVVA